MPVVDDVANLTMHITREVMRLLDMPNEAAVHNTGDSRLVRELLSYTPIFCMHLVLQHSLWGSLETYESVYQSGMLISSVVHAWRTLRLEGAAEWGTGATITVQQERLRSPGQSSIRPTYTQPALNL